MVPFLCVPCRYELVIARLILIFVLPLDFHGRLRVIRTVFIPGALHGIEASFLADTSLRQLRTAIFELYGLADSLLPILVQCSVCLTVRLVATLLFCVVWFRFRMLRRYLANRPGEVHGVYRLIGSAAEGCPGHGPADWSPNGRSPLVVTQRRFAPSGCAPLHLIPSFVHAASGRSRKCVWHSPLANV